MSVKEISPEIGTRLLFENDRVRVWDLQLAPGQSTGLHRHEHDYLYVVIGDGRLQGADAEGERWQANDMKDGEVRFNEVEEEAVHEARRESEAEVGAERRRAEDALQALRRESSEEVHKALSKCPCLDEFPLST